MITRILRYAILVFLGILWLTPIYLLLANSSKLTSEYSGLALWTPGNLPALFSNVVAVFTTTDVPAGLFTTLMYALIAPLVAVSLGAGIGYAVIALKLKNGFFWFFLVFCGTVFPLQMMIIPLFAAFTETGLFDTFVGMAIVYSVVSIPFSAFVMRNFFSGIAESVFEAAVVDGAGAFRIFARIYLPMSRSALIVVFILQATWVWNDFLLALILTQSAGTRPVMPLLQALQAGAQGGGAPFTVMLTAGLLVSIPTAVLFMLAQRSFQRGLALGQY